MDPREEELFKCMSVGILFRLGFQSLLTEAARRRGGEAIRWLDEFEARVIADLQRMSVHGPISDRIVYETVDAAAKEFKQVFAEARGKINAEPPGRRHRMRLHMKRGAYRPRRGAYRGPRRSY